MKLRGLFRRRSWVIIGLLLLCVVPFVFAFLTEGDADPPLSTEELLFVGEWFESHPNGSVSTLVLAESRNAYLVHAGRRKQRGVWHLEGTGGSLTIYEPQSLIQFDQSFGQNWTRLIDRVKSFFTPATPTIVSFPVQPRQEGKLVNWYWVKGDESDRTLTPSRVAGFVHEDPEIYVFTRTVEASKEHDDRQIAIWDAVSERLDQAIAERNAKLKLDE